MDGGLEDINKKLDNLLNVQEAMSNGNRDMLSALSKVESALASVGNRIDKATLTEKELLALLAETPAESSGIKEVEAAKSGTMDVEVLATIERIFALDTVEQSFCCQVFLRMLWLCPLCEEKTESGIPKPETDDGDWQPEWTPKYFFKNYLETKYDPQESYTPVVINGMVYVKAEIRHLMCIAEPLELKTFPVDCQELNIDLVCKLSTEQLRLKPMRLNLSMQPYKGESIEKANAKPFDTGSDMKTHEFARLIEHRCVLDDFKLVQQFPFMRNLYVLRLDDDKEVSALKMTINLTRKSFYYILNVWLVALCIVSFAFTSWGLHPGDVADRLGVDLTLVLTLVAFRLVLVSMLPKTSYLTWLDMYVMGTFVFLTVITVIHAIFPYTYFMKIELSAITLPPDGWPAPREQDMIDMDCIILYICAGAWTAFNVFFALFVMVRGSQMHGEFWRGSKKLQQEYDDAHDEVVDLNKPNSKESAALVPEAKAAEDAKKE
jgi:hypothetical protein